MVLPPVRGAWLRLPAPGAGSQQWERWDCLSQKYICNTHTHSKRTNFLWNTQFLSLTNTHTHLPQLFRLLGDGRASCELHFKQKPEDSVPDSRANPVALCCSPGNTPSGQTASLSSVNNLRCHVALERKLSTPSVPVGSSHSDTYSSTGTSALLLLYNYWLTHDEDREDKEDFDV